MTLRLRSQTNNFYVKVKVFTVSVFAKPLIDLIHAWHGDRNMSKILCDAIPAPWFCKAFDGFDSCLAQIDIRF